MPISSAQVALSGVGTCAQASAGVPPRYINRGPRYAMKLLLTDRFCQHAKSTEPQTDYFDETVKGLALRVTNQGTKSWTLHHGTPRKRVTLGRYPTVSLASA